MFRKKGYLIFRLFIFSSISFIALTSALASPPEDYFKYCSSCHHPERYGVSAPPLFKETIGNKNNKELIETISRGLPATNMPAFGEVLKAEEIENLIAYIRTPIEKPKWDKDDILNSKIVADSHNPQSVIRNL